MNKKLVQELIFSQEDSNQRLDNFACEKMGVTRSQILKSIKEERLLVNGEVKKPGYILRLGDEMSFYDFEVSRAVLEVPILFEDQDILVIDKPSGMSSHPAPGDTDITVTEALKEHLRSFTSEERPGIVHRLDKGTSGVMVLAKNDEALIILKKQFERRSVKKEYVALVHGNITPDHGIINMPIDRDIENRKKLSVNHAGKEAITEYKKIKDYPKYSLVVAMPKTGRTHQIRVHLSALGYPIAGDRKYGLRNEVVDIDRIFLHAKSIQFRHPKTGKLVAYEAKLPTSLETFLTDLG